MVLTLNKMNIHIFYRNVFKQKIVKPHKNIMKNIFSLKLLVILISPNLSKSNRKVLPKGESFYKIPIIWLLTMYYK